MLPKMNPAMMSGIMTVVMMNPRVRMRSRYSRRAMSQTLIIEVALLRLVELGHGEFPAVGDGQRLANLLDKDVFEGGLGDLEAGDTRDADGVGEQRLGVVGKGGRRAQLDLGVAAVALEAFDAGMLQEGIVAFEVDVDAVAGVARLDL